MAKRTVLGLMVRHVIEHTEIRLGLYFQSRVKYAGDHMISLEEILDRYPVAKTAIANKSIRLVRHSMNKWPGFNKILRFEKDVLKVFTAIFRPVVAFLLNTQAAFKMSFGSFTLGLFGLRWTSLIGAQLRVHPDQRLGLA